MFIVLLKNEVGIVNKTYLYKKCAVFYYRYFNTYFTAFLLNQEKNKYEFILIIKCIELKRSSVCSNLSVVFKCSVHCKSHYR